MNEITKTERGFNIFEFIDFYGTPCSLQESSLATEDAVWLGTYNDRMHLDKKMAKKLIELLTIFVKTGEIA